MNFIKFNNTVIGKGGFGQEEVLYISPPKMSVQRFDKEQIYGRDGYVHNSEDAYDGYVGEVTILSERKEDTNRLIEVLNTEVVNKKIFVNTTKYYQICTIIEHVAEQVSSNSWVHRLQVDYQPFWYDVDEQVHVDNI